MSSRPTGSRPTEGSYRSFPPMPLQDPKTEGPVQYPPSTPRNHSSSSSNPPAPETMERVQSPLVGRSLRNPGELGNPSPTQQRKAVKTTSTTFQPTRSSSSSSWIQAAAAGASAECWVESPLLEQSMTVSLAYRGMEIIVATSSQGCVFVVSARTRLVLQTLQVASTPVVALQAHASSGLIVVATAEGHIHTFAPMATNPNLDQPKHLSNWGRYRWVDKARIDGRDIFLAKGTFGDTRLAGDETRIDLSVSMDHKVLLARGDQLAIWDARPDQKAELLWTTQLEGPIAMAQISGDGQALACVLKEDGTNQSGLPFGVRTFVRDWDDGSRMLTEDGGVGILYKPSAHLVHSAPVTSISFRGLGHETSSISAHEDPGNDLLLTFDGDARIFSQHAWTELLRWSTPPKTRVDWVHGITAFCLGDLESMGPKKRDLARRNSIDSDGSPTQEQLLHQQLVEGRATSHPTPSTTAGAWISELTFRGEFPALRLSRISYIQRGSEETEPCHTESVAAILPTGSISMSAVLRSNVAFNIQGVWPAWNPWLSETTVSLPNETLQGSAMNFLGLSSGVPSSGAFFGEGSHSPPIELRMVCSHPVTGKVVLMEIPLCSDADFENVELGSPVRYVLSLSDIGAPLLMDLPKTDEEKKEDDTSELIVSMDFESSRLQARREQSSSIHITWRKPGTMSLISPECLPDDLVSDQVIPMVTKLASLRHKDGSEQVHDLSLIPAPLWLPPLHLPPNPFHDEYVAAMKWWPDEHFGGPPILLVVTSLGTLVVFELPPPWSSLEPPMPPHDPTMGVIPSLDVTGISANEPSGDDMEIRQDLNPYEVMISPHPDFGLGLRLESQIDGLPAIAGSYKKHPLNGGLLPAEKCGMIVLGDELLSVNGVSLEGISFDDIISTVRQVGSEQGPSAPICLKFRPVLRNRRRTSSAWSESGDTNNSEGRRSMEQILGVTPGVKRSDTGSSDASGPPAQPPIPKRRNLHSRQRTMMVGVAGESQQESRVIGTVGQVFADLGDTAQSCFVVLPWEKSLSLPRKVRGVALLVIAEKDSIRVARLQVAKEGIVPRTKLEEIGSFNIFQEEADKSVHPRRMEAVDLEMNERCLAVYDSQGAVRLLFISIDYKKEKRRIDGEYPTADSLVANFRQIKIFQYQGSIPKNCLIRAESVDLVATMPVDTDKRHPISIWMMTPGQKPRAVQETKEEAKETQHCHSRFDLKIESDSVSSSGEIVDFQFLRSGFLDVYPLFVTLTTTEAVVHQRTGDSHHWRPIIRFSYTGIPSSCLTSFVASLESKCATLNSRTDHPADAFPHLLPAIRTCLSSLDEVDLRSDWHPESLLAHICTEERGAKVALDKNVRGLFTWLTGCLNSGDVDNPRLAVNYPAVVAPLKSIGGHRMLEEPSDEEGLSSDKPVATAASLFMSAKMGSNGSDDMSLLRKFQSLLCQQKKLKSVPANNGTGYSRIHTQMNATVEVESTWEKGTQFLEKLSLDESRLLWIICDLVIEPPELEKLDPPAQLFSMAHSILHRIKKTPSPEKKEKKVASSYHHFMTRRTSSNVSNEKPPPQVTSAACVAALLSDSQGDLLEYCRRHTKTLDWASVREWRFPLWVRSDTTLKKICEEIGQATYREGRNILDCAIFFIITGKMRTLRNLAATDQGDSGRTFCTFISKYDFSSQQGRRATEKNAYSLLRKHRYQAAAAFFLLAQPPMIKTAVETIVTNMKDFDLAFMVSRLIEDHGQSSFQGMGAMAGLGGLSGFGGGGGYADPGSTSTSWSNDDDVKFQLWRPNLRRVTKNLLIHRGIPMAGDNPCLTALQLVWLGRTEEAALSLAGLGKPEEQGDSSDRNDDPFWELKKLQDMGLSHDARVVHHANHIIDFVACPFLIKRMRASSRARFASALRVSTSLSRRGIEISSIRAIVQNTDPRDLDEEEKLDPAPSDNQDENRPSLPVSGTTSAILRSLESPSLDQKQGSAISKSNAAGGGMISSIFDTFDAPKPPSASQTAVSGGMATSSIFDAFDTPPPSRKKKATVNSQTAGEMTSSIFDAFDAPPPPKPKQPSAHQTASSGVPGGEMTSPVFAAFDVPKPATQQSSALSGDMNSSIFDAFDTPAALVKKKADESRRDGGLHGTLKAEASGGGDDDDDDTQDVPRMKAPRVWLELRQHLLVSAVSRRLVRDVASVVSGFHGDAFDPRIRLVRDATFVLIPLSAAEVLRLPCDGNVIVDKIKRCLNDLCASCQLDNDLVVEHALRVLDSELHHYRMVFSVLLRLALERPDLAEDCVRDASHAVIQSCEAFSCCTDDLLFKGRTLTQLSSLYLRKKIARICWQLELCLWFHRGGVLPMSAVSHNEAVVAVRAGLVVASWNRNFECLESVIRYPPDCPADHETSRQLWTSLKLISGGEEQVHAKKSNEAGSGGWEFLVDCRRSEATEMLRERPTGSFIIRPNKEHHDVFTLSFKTNLVPTHEKNPQGTTSESGVKNSHGASSTEGTRPVKPKSRPVKKDDVVQHAIIRLSDSGFRCGSFGPFTTLMKLLEAVSSSLPFDLRFDQPPTDGVIKEEGAQASPNSVFLRMLVLSHAQHLTSKPPLHREFEGDLGRGSDKDTGVSGKANAEGDDTQTTGAEDASVGDARRKCFGMFSELLTLSLVRKQLSSVACVRDEGRPAIGMTWSQEEQVGTDYDDSVGSLSNDIIPGVNERFAIAVRMLRPLLSWCRTLEVGMEWDFAPRLGDVQASASLPVSLSASENAIELASNENGCGVDGGDTVIRRMIQPGSGVEFRTLRLGDSAESAMVVLFSKNEAVEWFINSGTEKTRSDALARLDMMEKKRVIETIDLKKLALKAYASQKQVEEQGVRYRIVDPWEVEALVSREAETQSAAIGRERFLAFSLSQVAKDCEVVFRSMGGLPLLELWTATKGGVVLTKAIASVHPPWERGVGGDLCLKDGAAHEPSPLSNSIRRHLYRNVLYRRLDIPQRFLALIQVELLDLKNLTSPGGNFSLNVYALLRLKRSRPGSGAPLTNKARTLDSAATIPMKLGKSSGPIAPASWGSLVRFRFPLPETVRIDGVSCDADREALFKGPPSVLQVSVYEKKFMSDTPLGDADVKMDGLDAGGQLEEWVPLRTSKHGINWFARIRLTLRFELMCLASEDDEEDTPSVGLRRIEQLSQIGGVQEEIKKDINLDIKKSVSTPDLLSYFESFAL